MSTYVLALDQGTTSSRAIVFDDSGQAIGMAQREFEQRFPQPGWVEHQPEEIWTSQLQTAREALASAKIQPNQIAAIGITNQRETTVVWDRATGKPIHNAIVWQDRRTADYCSRLAADPSVVQLIQQRTGLVIDAYFSASKIKWILDHVEGARRKAMAGELAFGTIDSWLVWNLTNGQLHITDSSNASRTMLCRIDSVEWDPDLLQLFDIPASLLPEIRQSSEVYGSSHKTIFGQAIPIAGIAGDQQSALFGQACHQPGMAKNTYGTGCFLLMNTGTEQVASKHNLLTTVAWTIDQQTEYALEGSVFIGGAIVQWLRDQLGIIQTSAEIEQLASEVDDSGGAFFVPAFSGLGAPHWDGFARGTITGLTRGTNKAHLARAALEAIALQSNDLLAAMQKDSGIQLTELRADGGATNNELLMQIQANISGVPLTRPQSTEITAMGAAYLAGLATGIWAKSDIAANWRRSKTFSPEKTAAIDDLKHGWSRAVDRSKQWIEKA